MPLTAGEVLQRAAELLQDVSSVRWTQAELMRWLNDGRRELCIFRPDLYAVTAVIPLAGGTRQQIPDDGTRFIDAIRNMEPDGLTPGPAVRIIEREFLDAHVPNWHAGGPGPVQHFMFDERAPLTFYVYPPAFAASNLEIAYAKEPVEITDTATPLNAERLYTSALVDYVCYRAFAKDATFAGNMQRSAVCYQQFKLAIGEGDARDLATSPNTAKADGVPPRSGG